MLDFTKAGLWLLFSGVLLVSSCQPTGIELSEKHADRIVIVKSAHIMMLTNGNQVLRTYRVALGRESAGLKEYAGDHKTPEGKYIVDSKGDHSLFYLALHLSYPNAADAERAQKLGKDPGGAIEIHGLPNLLFWVGPLHRSVDWTGGCIAVTDSEMKEIWSLVPVGTPVESRH